MKQTTNIKNTNQFKLVPFFSLASIVMFLLVAAVLAYFVTQQSGFFNDVQTQQIKIVSNLQNSFAKQQQEVSRRDLLAIHESGNVNLTRLFANSLWVEHMAPFVASTALIPSDHCYAMPDVVIDGKSKASAEKKACFSEIGAKIRQLPGFDEINFKVFDSMKKSSVFKIKVFDLRGLTVYSSEHSQIGDSKLDNKGWQSALAGVPASELTHRDTFSAFEGVVEDRDVIGSYLPVYEPGSDKMVGVFEVYSDVTQFLSQIKKTSNNIDVIASNNLRQVENEAQSNLLKIKSSSTIMLIIIISLLVVLFVALLFIVLRADKIIKLQSDEREKSQSQLAQSEKMASLGQMVAGVAHQLNTPIAFSHSNITMVKEAVQDFNPSSKMFRYIADYFSQHDSDRVTLTMHKNKQKLLDQAENMPEVEMVGEMLDDTLNGLEQMRELVDNLQAFTRLDRAKTAKFDLNKGLKNVVYMAKSVIPTGITVTENYADLPEVTCNPSQLNQIFLNLINNAAHALAGKGEITVSSQQAGSTVQIKVKDNGQGIPADVLPHIFDMYYTTKPEGEGTGMGLGIARTIAQEHGGEITVESLEGQGTTVTVTLPIDQA